VANPIEFKRLSAIGIVGVAANIAKCDLSRDGEPTRVRAQPLTLAAVLGKGPALPVCPPSLEAACDFNQVEDKIQATQASCPRATVYRPIA
jgi:hypothetical protein